MGFFTRSSLSKQFFLISFPAALLGMLVISYLIGKQVEKSVLHRVGAETGRYVDSFVLPHIQSLLFTGTLNNADHTALNSLLAHTPLGEKIVAIKIWWPDGRILYSTDTLLTGRSFPIGEGLTKALSGHVYTEISELFNPENTMEAAKWSKLVQTYIPIFAPESGDVMAIAEFYQSVDEVTLASTTAKRHSWMVVAITVLLSYSLLFVLVHRGSLTIDRQRNELKKQVAQLLLSAQNEQLHERVQRAAATTTSLNESILRRISADLHDGPGQDLGFALMRFETIVEFCANCPGGQEGKLAMAEALQPIHSAIKLALTDLRSICAGLRLPEIELLTLNMIAERAVDDYQGKTGAKVALLASASNTPSSLPVKIALYRLLQESLSNGFRHAAAVGQRIEIKTDDGRLLIEISDEGSGFDRHAATKEGHLGLLGMRERVEVLGGSFDLYSKLGLGTVIRVNLPLVVPEMEYA